MTKNTIQVKGRGGLRFEVSGHDIWGERTSNHTEDNTRSVESHLNASWKNRDLKLPILGDFGHFLAGKYSENGHFMHITELCIECILQSLYVPCCCRGLERRQRWQE